MKVAAREDDGLHHTDADPRRSRLSRGHRMLGKGRCDEGIQQLGDGNSRRGPMASVHGKPHLVEVVRIGIDRQRVAPNNGHAQRSECKVGGGWRPWTKMCQETRIARDNWLVLHHVHVMHRSQHHSVSQFKASSGHLRTVREPRPSEGVRGLGRRSSCDRMGPRGLSEEGSRSGPLFTPLLTIPLDALSTHNDTHTHTVPQGRHVLGPLVRERAQPLGDGVQVPLRDHVLPRGLAH